MSTTMPNVDRGRMPEFNAYIATYASEHYAERGRNVWKGC